MDYKITLVFKDGQEIDFVICADSPFIAIKSLYSNPYLIFENVKNIICLLNEEE